MRRIGANDSGPKRAVHVGRNLRVCLHGIQFAGYLVFKYLSGQLDARLAGVRLRDHLQQLGGVYIKLGQALALRYDAFPVPFCQELSELLDRVEPFDSRRAIAIIEEELRQPMSLLFASFDSLPVASASFGQVHNATLHCGEKVVVKIQRPNLGDMVRTDLSTVRMVLKLIDMSGVLHRVKLSENFDEFRRWTLEELSYLREARHAECLAEDSRSNPREKIPRVYRTHTTDRILTLERLEGTWISELMDLIAGADDPASVRRELRDRDLDTRTIAHNLLSSTFAQIFNYRSFHADPHPDNLIVMKDGIIGYVDFGLVGRMDEEFRRYQLDFLAALRDGDLDTLFEIFVDYVRPPFDVDLGGFQHVFKRRFAEWLERSDDPHASFRERSFVALVFETGLKELRRYRIPLPRSIAAYYKTFATIDPIILTLAPDLDFKAELHGFLRESLIRYVRDRSTPAKLCALLLEYQELLLTLPREARRTLKMWQRAQSGATRAVDRWLVHWWKLVRSVVSGLVLSLLVVRIWVWRGGVPIPAGLRLFFLSPFFWVVILTLVLYRGHAVKRYEQSVTGHFLGRA